MKLIFWDLVDIHIMKFVLSVFLNTAFSLALMAQGREPDIKFRLAQSYEQSGDFESAVKLHEQILASDSSNIIILEALNRNYVQLKKYDAAIYLVSRALQRSPSDILLLSRLGTLYNLKGDEKHSTASWEKAIAVDPSREGTYRTVAASMTESRLFERAIDVYQRGRTACNAPGLFTNDIAYLYTITLNYTGATTEYIRLIRQTPTQLSYAQSRISSYIVRPDGLKGATTVAEEFYKKEPDNLQFQQLLAWLYMEAKQYDRAYDIYKILDAKSNAGGHEIFNFAERAFRERGYAAALKAYSDLVAKYPKFDLIAQVRFGYARTMEESITQRDTSNPFASVGNDRLKIMPETESAPMYTGAIAAYEEVVVSFPGTEFAARSLYRIAVLKQERFFDLDGARAALESLAKNMPASPVLLDATVRLGDIYLAMGNMSKAEEFYKKLTERQLIAGEQRERAALRLAELAYFRGELQKALGLLENLTRNAAADITNDALKLKFFIAENSKEDSSALKEFAKGELLLRQRKISEAHIVFKSIPTSYPASTLDDDAVMYVGEIEIQLKRYTDGITSFERLQKDYPESIILDVAIMKIGYTYEIGLHEKVKAIASYEQLLERFPSSIYVNEARKRIRELRGDTL